MSKQLVQARVDAPLVPNAVTIEAMREARRGDLPRFASVEDLLDDLHADESSEPGGSSTAASSDSKPEGTSTFDDCHDHKR